MNEVGGEQHHLVDPHRVRLGETRVQIGGIVDGWMLGVRAEGTDHIPIHPRP